MTVWLPFAPDLVPDVPDLDFAYYPGEGAPVPDPAPDPALAELYVVPYQAVAADVEVLARMPRLRAVQTLTAGVDHVLPHLPEGVALHNGRGIHDASTAELAVGLALAAQRSLPEFVRAQDREEWLVGPRDSLADKTVLIIGYGAIGAAIEARLLPFETTVVRVARTARDGVHAQSELPALLPVADIVVLVLPATAESRGLVDARFLASMKDGALLVNVARGVIVDTAALVAELHTGRLRAALDVTDPEPLPPGHPLWSCPGLLLSPHTGGNTSAMMPRALRLVGEQLRRWAGGEPLLNRVDA